MTCLVAGIDLWFGRRFWHAHAAFFGSPRLTSRRYPIPCQGSGRAWTPGGSNLTLHIYDPDAAAEFPVIFFASGFAADVPTFAYNDLIQRIVSLGYVFVGLEQLGVPQYLDEAANFLNIMAWGAAGNLTAAMRASNLKASPDVLGRSVVMGQSSGCHIVGQALQDQCSVAKAVVFIDPVDGYDPFRMVRPLHALPTLFSDEELLPWVTGSKAIATRHSVHGGR